MYNRHNITKFLKLIFSACFILVLSACSSSDDTDTTVETVTEIPQFIQKLALDTTDPNASLLAGITIDGGAPILMDLAGGTASASIPGLSRTVHTVQILFAFTDGVDIITLATATGTVDLSSGDASLSFADADYNVSYDDDNDGINNLTEIINGTYSVAAPVAYDFEDGMVPVTLSMSGNVAWAIDISNGSGGSISSLRSGNITDNQTSCVAITVSDSSNVSFDFMVSSELDYDFLRFYIDNILQDEMSGSVFWTAVAYGLPTIGTYEYKWCYEKDDLESTGSDAAWIDNITIN